MIRSLLFTFFGIASLPALAAEKPNVVVIFADDMGIDCVSAFNEKLGFKTPHLDRLADEGMSFMDAHTTSAVCTPSRYGLLTGRYNWRSRLKRGIVGKWERPLIEEGRLTLPGMLKQHGYATTMIGKWHLGFHWPKQGGGFTEKEAEIDFKGAIKGGPNHIGFDYWFGDDVPNWPPYAWRENEKLLGDLTTTAKEIGITSYVGVGNGPAVADWSLEAVLPEYAKRCKKAIHGHAKSDNPFFLYFPMPSPHTPIVPDEKWKGKSGISDYADFLLETDWAVGEVLQALEDSGQAENTLVFFTTDNGTSPKADFDALARKGVDLTANWRGNKADAFEGGHRVPFIVRWPGQIEAGTRSDELISVADIMATVAELVSHELPGDAAEDSLSLLPLLKEEELDAPLHEAVICHSISGHFAVRKGKWKIMFCKGSGGWSQPTEPAAAKADLPAIQLYDLEEDPKETTNLAEEKPEVVSELTEVLRRYVEEGRSTKGPRQENHNGENHWGHLPWEKNSIAEKQSFRMSVKIPRPVPEEGVMELPTPFSHIVRATSGGDSKYVRWSFNKDASEIKIHLTDREQESVQLVVAENSGVQRDGLIIFSALDSEVVGEKAKLETHPGNHRIGFWVNGDDFVKWELATPGLEAGKYEVELVYSRAGNSDATASVTINEQTIPVPLQSTGSWYEYQVQALGEHEISAADKLNVEVRSVKQSGAVMNLKAVLLHPKN